MDMGGGLGWRWAGAAVDVGMLHAGVVVDWAVSLKWLCVDWLQSKGVVAAGITGLAMGLGGWGPSGVDGVLGAA